MLSEVDSLMSDLRTDKVATRQKAFNKLHDFLTHRLSDLQRIIDDDEDGNISWEGLFKSTHLGIVHQADKLSKPKDQPSQVNFNDPQITNYSKVMCQLCDNWPTGKKASRVSQYFVHNLILFQNRAVMLSQ